MTLCSSATSSGTRTCAAQISSKPSRALRRRHRFSISGRGVALTSPGGRDRNLFGPHPLPTVTFGPQGAPLADVYQCAASGTPSGTSANEIGNDAAPS